MREVKKNVIVLRRIRLGEDETKVLFQGGNDSVGFCVKVVVAIVTVAITVSTPRVVVAVVVTVVFAIAIVV